MPRAQGIEYLPRSGGWFPAQQGGTGNPRLSSLYTETELPLSPAFLLHCYLPHYIHLEGGWVSLFLFRFLWKVTCKRCLLWTEGGHCRHTSPAQSVSPMEGRRTEDDPSLMGNRNSPAERGKTGRRLECIITKQLSTPPSIFQIVSSFLCNHFLLKRKK